MIDERHSIEEATDREATIGMNSTITTMMLKNEIYGRNQDENCCYELQSDVPEK
jgi:hypothetical protein